MKYTANMFESIKDSLKKSSAPKDESFKDFMKMEKGKNYTVRLLPNVEDPSKTFFEYFYHTFQSKAKKDFLVNVFCPNTYGDRCPIDEYRAKSWKTFTEEERKMIAPLKRSQHWLVNVYVIKDPTNPENNGQVKILKYGKQLDKIIKDALGEESDEFGARIFDLSKNGCNLKIKVEENEGGYASYVSSRFQSPSEIEGLENPDDVYESVRTFDTIFKHQSYEEIQRLLDEHWFCTAYYKSPAAINDDDDYVVPTQKKSEKAVEEAPVSEKAEKVEKAKPAPSSDDDELDELLKGL